MGLDQAAKKYLFSHARLVALQLDASLNVTAASPGCLTALGYPPEEMVGHGIFEWLIADDAETADNLQRGRTFTGRQVQMRRLEEGPVALLASFYSEPDHGLFVGEVVGQDASGQQHAALELHKRAFSLAKTIEDLKRRNGNLEMVNKWMREKAITDPTTGLFKRNHLDYLLQTEWERAKRHRGDLSFILVGIDGLRPFREVQGAEPTLQIVRGVARVVEARKRIFDILGHFDNETLFLVLPHTPATGAREFADRLVGMLKDREIRAADYPFRIFLSIGVATYHHKLYPLKSHEELIHIASEALADAQLAGGNRSVANQTPLPAPRAVTRT